MNCTLCNMCMIEDEATGRVLVQHRLPKATNPWCGLTFPGGHVEVERTVEETEEPVLEQPVLSARLPEVHRGGEDDAVRLADRIEHGGEVVVLHAASLGLAGETCLASLPVGHGVQVERLDVLAVEERLGEQAFRYGYTALKNLPILTEVREDGDYFIDLCNQTTHGGALLSLPDYDVEKVPDYTGIDIAADKTAEGKTMHFDRGLNMEFSVGQYHSNMATYMILAKWLDDLKEWGVYDNTRIIFVSDHGFWLENFDYMTLEIGPDLEAINALLMVKDFNSREPLRIWGTRWRPLIKAGP